jgi:hypothetical protein
MPRVVIEDGRAVCRKLRDLARAMQSSASLEGIRVVPEFREARSPRLRVHDRARSRPERHVGDERRAGSPT